MIPITDNHAEYANEAAAELKANGIRVEVDDSNGRMNAKIRDAQLQKVPYMLIVGDREAESKSVAVRTRLNEDRGAIPLAEFVDKTRDLIEFKSLEV